MLAKFYGEPHLHLGRWQLVGYEKIYIYIYIFNAYHHHLPIYAGVKNGGAFCTLL